MKRIYRWLGLALTPLLPLWLKRRAAIGKEDPTRIEERFGITDAIIPAAPIIWLHAASVGEAQSILPLTAAMHAALPQHHFLITTGTRTSAALIAASPAPYLTHQYAPLDVPRAVKRFLAHWRPHLAMWVESELWPHLIWKTSSRHIPMMLVNGRMSARSFRRWSRWRGMAESMLGSFDAVFAGSEEDAARLRLLGARDVVMAGNLKFDAPPLPVDYVTVTSLQSQIGQRPVWLAASTHAGEEELVLKAHEALRALYPDLLTIIVPRHANRGDDIASMLAAQSARVSRRSTHEPITPATEIYLADTMGELGSFYHAINVVFMGGSLINHGGHNPLEPARLDCAIISGPYIHNFAPIMDEMQQQHALMVVPDEAQLAHAIQHFFTEPQLRRDYAARAKSFAEATQGATPAIVATAKRLLEEGSA